MKLRISDPKSPLRIDDDASCLTLGGGGLSIDIWSFDSTPKQREKRIKKAAKLLMQLDIEPSAFERKAGM